MAVTSLDLRQPSQLTSVCRHDEFMRLFVHLQPRLYAYIRSLVPNRTDAEEVLQETGVVLWKKFDDFEPGSEFARWATRVARLQVLAFYKRRKRNVLHFSQSFVEAMADEAVALTHDASPYYEALEGCLAKLSPADRDLIRRRYECSSRTARQVAREQGRPETTVYNALARIRRNLLRCMQLSLEHA
jgi:RNA polymerase sigma-70 factor (ECF subfamily)